MKQATKIEKARRGVALADELVRIGREISGEEIAAFTASLTTARRILSDLEERERKRRAAFDAVPVLQAVVRHGEETRVIVVAKPNGRIDEPHISLGYYNALRKDWPDGEITTDSEYGIAVVDTRGRVCARIKTTTGKD